MRIGSPARALRSLVYERLVGLLAYERRWGIRTDARIDLEEFGYAHPERTWYQPAGWRTLRRILPRSEVSPDDVFLDIGSGMGRMVILAARYPFRKVIGVEIVPELHEIAQQNLARTRRRLRCPQVELVNADVVEFEIPDDVSIVFCNNPVRGELFRTLIERLLQSLDRAPRRIRLIYYNAREREVVEQTGRARLLDEKPASFLLYELR